MKILSIAIWQVSMYYNLNEIKIRTEVKNKSKNKRNNKIINNDYFQEFGWFSSYLFLLLFIIFPR